MLMDSCMKENGRMENTMEGDLNLVKGKKEVGELKDGKQWNVTTYKKYRKTGT